ncbi:MAG TPA: hypothetical protein DCS82_07815 [Rhodospirillaceae bacterium]|nr:hypothetical protein [Rhodospirillaceae bacterium]HAT35606.1 hypothetical protein [Rhodospirillaceae bacterium]
MSQPSSPPIPRRALIGTYGIGLFAGGQWDMMGILIPLFAVFVGLSPSEIGLVVAARSVLPVLFSIHGGVLMDRFGTRNVAFWLAIFTSVLPLLYPLAGWFWALATLQLVSGHISTLAMASGQTLINQLSKGDPTELGRFSFVTRFANFAGPVLIGFVWHQLGVWPAFLVITLWGLLILASVTLIPNDGNPRHHSTASLKRFWPRWSDYREAFALATIPAVAFALAITMIRNGPGSIQASFFVVYLDQIGISGTTIGLLTGLSEIFVGIGSLAAGWFAARAQAHWLVIIFVAAAVFFICLTPLVAHAIPLLVIATAMRGFSQGVNQPLIFSILSRNVGLNQQGAAVGLRNSVNRLANIIVPTAMGYIAEWWGIETSFGIIAIILLSIAVVIAVSVKRKAVF